MFFIIQSIVQLLYLYKISYWFYAHIFLVIVLTILIPYLLFKKKQIQEKDANPKPSNFSQKVNYLDYVKNLKENTNRQVQKLQQSEKYKQYMRKKNQMMKTGKYYKDQDQVSDIVLSDDSSVQQNRKHKTA